MQAITKPLEYNGIMHRYVAKQRILKGICLSLMLALLIGSPISTYKS